MTRHYIIPIFVPHFGCPHDCVFCNQRKITGLSTDITTTDVKKIIDEHLKTFKKDSFIEVAFYGGSFTAIEKGIQEQLLAVPFEYKMSGQIQNIRLSTRPDAINDEILNLLESYAVDIIELGVQSLDNDVLIQSERGHTDTDVYEASKLIKKRGFKLGHQIMLGLPGDTKEKSLSTAKRILEMSPDMIRIYPTLVIRNTALERLMQEGNYKPISLNEAIEISAEILMVFKAHNIPVIRIGLQPTENIQMGRDVVAGPFHPAFRQLVEETVFKSLFLENIYRNRINVKGKSIVIECSNSMASVIAGQHGKNRELLKRELDFVKLRIVPGKKDDDRIVLAFDDNEIFIDLKYETELYNKNNPL
ncbi:elongator complex protein 3 [Gudongella sp. DL1XJH-153]|uniref:elongator complex protein 3 n=1 Tax=Gudongella sp. DL1XJH-153 TaxID=3409804 RepID=UPI003BB7CE03